MLEEIKGLILALDDRDLMKLEIFMNRLKQEKAGDNLETRKEIFQEFLKVKNEDGEPFFSEEYLRGILKIK